MESGSHTEPTNIKNCSNGHDLPPGAAFCPECGASAQAIEADVEPRESGESKCGNGHSVPEGISSCVICGEETADEPAQNPIPTMSSTPNRKVAIVVGAILALALVAGLIWWTQGRGMTESEEQLYDECWDQYAWAFNTRLEDEGSYEYYHVLMEFGASDGRLDTAYEFWDSYLWHRDAIGHDRAVDSTAEQVKAYCTAVSTGLVVDGTPVEAVLSDEVLYPDFSD